MDRRHFIFALTGMAATLAASRPLHAECGEMSSIEFVEVTWEKQARLHKEKAPLGEEAFYALFSSEMQKLMRAPRSMPANMPVGPLLNAFFGYGVLPGAEVEIGKIALVSGQGEGPATIGVAIKHRGERSKVLVHVIRESDDWRVANIIYDSGKSLINHYRAMTAR
jgi:hypothetical protein